MEIHVGDDCVGHTRHLHQVISVEFVSVISRKIAPFGLVLLRHDYTASRIKVQGRNIPEWILVKKLP